MRNSNTVLSARPLVQIVRLLSALVAGSWLAAEKSSEDVGEHAKENLKFCFFFLNLDYAISSNRTPLERFKQISSFTLTFLSFFSLKQQPNIRIGYRLSPQSGKTTEKVSSLI